MKFYYSHCSEMACQMYATARIKVNMMLDSRRGRLLSFGRIWQWQMEVDCGDHCLSPRNKCRLELYEHRLGFLGECLDHTLRSPILMVSIGRAWFLYLLQAANTRLKVLLWYSPRLLLNGRCITLYPTRSTQA